MPISKQLANIRNAMEEVFDNIDVDEMEDAIVIRMKKERKMRGIQTTLKGKPAPVPS